MAPFKIQLHQCERMILLFMVVMKMIFDSADVDDDDDDDDGDDDDDDDDGHVVDDDDDDDDDDAKEATQSSTSLPRGNQVDGLPRVCSCTHLSPRADRLQCFRARGPRNQELHTPGARS